MNNETDISTHTPHTIKIRRRRQVSINKDINHDKNNNDIKQRERQENVEVKEFKKKYKCHIMTSIFNTETWNQNRDYRENHKEIGCIYSSPFSITSEIPPNEILFILEMNNDTNKIMGIGMVLNKPSINTHRVYTKETYNHNTYRGKNYIGREEMTDYQNEIITIFDVLCFTGNYHMKRGQGIKQFPVKILYRISKRIDLVGFIKGMFEKLISTKKT